MSTVAQCYQQYPDDDGRLSIALGVGGHAVTKLVRSDV